jgi:hypothetical protein
MVRAMRSRHGVVRKSRGMRMIVDAPGTEKGGKACAESILGLIAHGDASVRAVKANGRIKEVTSVDHSVWNFFGDSRRVVDARAREIARRVPVVRRLRHAAR